MDIENKHIVEAIEVGFIIAVPIGSVFVNCMDIEGDSRVFYKLSDDEMYVFNTFFDRPSEKHIIRKRTRTINKHAFTTFTCVKSISEEDLFYAMVTDEWDTICRVAGEYKNRLNDGHFHTRRVRQMIP